ncbi:translation initiation factor eIF2B subunit gamma-like [Convolutriloba macropyga]|uniref:translation initiation factor eIF2B subunit gamma-like n=1 Tax=Convolutriloba macropyga TaxID=536237 RepID=UPI003F528B92
MLDTVQAVLMAGAFEGSALYPVASSNLPQPLLPVCNKPMISYSISMLERAGISSMVVVVPGSDASQVIRAHFEEFPPNIAYEICTVDPGCGSAVALRNVLPKLKSQDFLLLFSDVVTDCNLSTLIASHKLNGASATLLLGRTRTSPSSNTKPGKAPKNVDFIGLDQCNEQLLFCYSKSEKNISDVNVLLAPLKRAGPMKIRTDLVNVQVYMLRLATVIAVFAQGSGITSVKEDFVPKLVQQQFKSSQGTSLSTATSADDTLPLPTVECGESRPGSEDWQGLNHLYGASGSRGSGWCGVLLVDIPNYCARVTSAAEYGDVNREVADPVRFEALTSRKLGKHENYVPGSARLGTRSTVGAACAVGEYTCVGDKCSIKRSVLGENCSIGNNCKIANSVLMDRVTVADGCDIRNSIICNDCELREGAAIKDCQVGHAYTVGEGADHKDEVLSAT